jgi:hypothetical protein
VRWTILAIFAAAAFAQQPDNFTPIRFLEGKWEGRAAGEPGEGTSTREYKFDLGGRFLVGRNKSVYQVKPPATKPEIHEDLGLFSYDRGSKKIVLRQFHVEGFVNEYTLDSVAPDGKSLEFVTTRIENIPPGWKAKEAYRVVSADEIEETFSLAAPGKEFEVYSRTLLKRVR